MPSDFYTCAETHSTYIYSINKYMELQLVKIMLMKKNKQDSNPGHESQHLPPLRLTLKVRSQGECSDNGCCLSLRILCKFRSTFKTSTIPMLRQATLIKSTGSSLKKDMKGRVVEKKRPGISGRGDKRG